MNPVRITFLSLQSAACLYLLLLFSCQHGGNIQASEVIPESAGAKINDLFGVNAFEWDFLQNPDDLNDIDSIYEPHMELIKSFRGVRHYLDWENLELSEGSYSFNPAIRGGWNYDLIYERCKKEGIDVLVCIKNSPAWLYNTYPQNERDNENIPIPYGAKRDDPKSYMAMGRMAFQFAARYGSNKSVDSSLIKLNQKPRWRDDSVNQVKIGLGLVNYVECNNEPDKWWKGKKAQQSGREYAANLSAFYDGNKGKLGKNVGIKAADPNMKVVMGGLGRADISFVKEMVEWCKENRGFKKDGTIDLCFDVLNYHMYSNDNMTWFSKMFKNYKRGVAPEINDMAAVADEWVEYGNALGNIPVWTTESGYDLRESSVQRAIPIGPKAAVVTQADWILRSSLLYARHGIKRVFFYQLFDGDGEGENSGSPFGKSGLTDRRGRRPISRYMYGISKLFGDYKYTLSQSKDPVVDLYTLGAKRMFVLYIPQEKGSTQRFELVLNNIQKVTLYTPNPDVDTLTAKEMTVANNKIKLEISETPIFVQAD